MRIVVAPPRNLIYRALRLFFNDLDWTLIRHETGAARSHKLVDT
jgi:hypothetical protein